MNNNDLHSAIEFFKFKNNLESIDCKFIFNEKYVISLFGIILGNYDIKNNIIEICGCKYRSRNDLVKTVFHELIHYWQCKIVKKLKLESRFKNGEFCQDINENKSLIKDVYHYHEHPHVINILYNNLETNNIEYRKKPHEIEATDLSNELFNEWNLPKFKGKLKFNE